METTTSSSYRINRTRRWLAAGAVLVFAAGFAAPARAERSRVSVSVGVNVPLGGHEFHHGHDRYYAYHGNYYRWDRDRYYRVPPPRGYYINRLPHNSVRFVFGTDVFYFADDVYYRPAGDRYVIVEPPPQVIYQQRTSTPVDREIAAAPAPKSDALVEVWKNDQRYLLSNGEYFKPGPEGRVWVPTPVGATIKTLPIGAETVWHEDNEYFEFDGGYFRRSPDGFKVVDAPWKKDDDKAGDDSASAKPGR